jgi:hypothetical protein
MKVLLTEWFKDWRGAAPQVLKPAVLPLDDQRIVFGLIVMLANGEYDEVCIETDSNDARHCIQNMLRDTGNAKKVGQSSDAERCRLYRAGYEIYQQGPGSYFFVNPTPRPELFAMRDLNSYVAEFTAAN